MKRILSLALAALLMGATYTGPFFDGFETGAVSTGWTGYALSGDLNPEQSPCMDVVEAPIRHGNKALRITLRANDWVTSGDKNRDKERAELIRNRVGDEGKPGTENWYSWSIYIPTNYSFTSTSSKYQIMGQWHDNPKPGDPPAGYVPPISVHYLNDYIGPRFQVRMGLQSVGGRVQKVDVPIVRGEWTDLLFHVRFSRGTDGFVEWWADGKAMPTMRGANLYNDQPNYLRIGLYRGTGQRQTNILYYDDIRVAPTRELLGLVP